MGDDHALEIVGIGIVKIKIFVGTVRKIEEVRHVKGLKKKLLSLGQIDSLGYKTYVENGIIKIVKCELVLMKAKNIGANLFMLKGKKCYRKLMCVSMWHQISKWSQTNVEVFETI